MNDDPEIISLENIDVLTAENCKDKCLDVEAGVMYADCEIPDVLPICITQDYVNDNFNLSVFSYGGYTPDESATNILILKQWKTGLCGALNIIWDEGVEYICPNGCIGKLYTASFEIIGGGPIMFESNHVPSVYNCPGDDCSCWVVDCPPSQNLGKFVKASIETSWEGCPKPDQKFQLMLAHKRYFQGP